MKLQPAQAVTLVVRETARAHAKLSASGSEKWLTCTRSARLEEQFPDEKSVFAAEGTFAHEVFELLIKRYLQRVSTQALDKAMAAFQENQCWSAELHDHVTAAVSVAIEAIEQARRECKDPVILVEQRLDFSRWVPGGFGTGDLVIVTDKWVWVLDLKYGKGVPVDATGNTQFRLYGLGAYNELAHLYEIKAVRMTVLQPRLDNYATCEMTVDELLDWAEDVVVPRAQMAWAGEGEFVPGPHCSSCFCRARFQCAARAEQALELAKADFALTAPELLTTDQLVRVLAVGDQVAKWIGDVQAYALSRAERGEQIPGFKVVEGRSNRKYADQDAVAQKLAEVGIPDEVIYERSLLGITAMEKAIGKKKFAELLDDLVVKPQGKPTLVPVDDKRPAISSVASAAEDFQ